MKYLLILMTLIIQNSYGYSVIDNLYVDQYEVSANRNPASNEQSFCLANVSDKVFAKSCYGSFERCEKRLAFWQDLPGDKPVKCIKI